MSAAKARDPSRLYSGNSGSANCCQAIEPPSTDVRDAHLYPGPYAPLPDHRASVSTEFGTCEGLEPTHQWFPDQTGTNPGPEARVGQLERQWDGMIEQLRVPGASAAVYVELYDIEQELAGLYTYDRRVARCNAATVRALNDALIASSRDESNLVRRAGALPADQPIGYWSFDEGVGTMAHDASASGHHLTLENGAGWAADGVSGSALDVRGGGQRAAAAGPVVDTTASFTVAAWLRHRDRSQTTVAVSQLGPVSAGFQLGLRTGDERPDLAPAYGQFPPDPAQYPPWRWTFDVPDSAGCLDAECGVRVNSSYGDLGLLPAEGRWQHVAGVYDREKRAISIYIDGAHIGTERVEHSWSAAGIFQVGMGQATPAELTGFDGSIDELRVYGRALSAAEAAALSAVEPGRARVPSVP